MRSLAIEVETPEQARARFPRALWKVWDSEALAKDPAAESPHASRANVFDIEWPLGADGSELWRVIVGVGIAPSLRNIVLHVAGGRPDVPPAPGYPKFLFTRLCQIYAYLAGLPSDQPLPLLQVAYRNGAFSMALARQPVRPSDARYFARVFDDATDRLVLAMPVPDGDVARVAVAHGGPIGTAFGSYMELFLLTDEAAVMVVPTIDVELLARFGGQHLEGGRQG